MNITGFAIFTAVFALVIAYMDTLRYMEEKEARLQNDKPLG